ELFQSLRQASPEAASAKVVDLLNRGIAPQSIWDALFNTAGELLMRRPDILSLHAVTSTNALHFAFQNCAVDQTRRLLLLQNASFLTLFRGGADELKPVYLDQLEPEDRDQAHPPALDEIFAELSQDRTKAAQKTLAWLRANPAPEDFINAARRLVFLKG